MNNKAGLSIGYTLSTTSSGFVDMQSKGGAFTQQSTLTSGIPAGASVTGINYKRQVIAIGPGGYMSAPYGV